MNHTSPTPGDRLRLHLDSLASGGEAVGRHEGLAVFARGGCPGDDAVVELTEVTPRFARGLVVEVLTPSPERVEPPCGYSRDCGGCQWQHLAYPAQLRHKTALLRDALARIAGLPNVAIAETWGMEDPWHYRNRAEYHAEVDPSGHLVLGFLRHHTHEVIPVDRCQLQHPLSERVRAATVELMARLAQSPTERALLYKLDTFVSVAQNQVLATLVCQGRPEFLPSLAQALKEQVPEVAGVLSARSRGPRVMHRSPAEVVLGRSRLVEKLDDHEYHVSADFFFQVNPVQAARTVAVVQEWAGLRKGESVVDAYCGVGTFLLPLAESDGPALGIESDESALNDARLNAQLWHLRNVHLQRGKVESVLPNMAREGGRCDVLVLDPPRKGCGPIVSVAATRLRPRRILLISCDPATLARDLKTLAAHGYPPKRIQPIDMFPHTWHVEAVAVCERA
jgi:23S rRNA (uracil1939-C5)-methyltransferase